MEYAFSSNAGHKIGEASLLFEKIEDDVIQRQLDKLAATKEANLAAENSQNIESQKDTIQFDDFQKMDIRVSTILAAEKVAKTKKLLKLTVAVSSSGLGRGPLTAETLQIMYKPCETLTFYLTRKFCVFYCALSIKVVNASIMVKRACDVLARHA